MRQSLARYHVVVAFMLIALGSRWSDANAQAWVGEKGALDLGLDYNFATSNKVLVDKGDDFPDAGTTTHQLTISSEYVPLPRLAVSLALPLAFLKYTGDKTLYPHAGGGSYDDGNVHATLTDLRVGARYQVLEVPFALSPHLAVSIPVADYETVGNTVAGRHVKKLYVGFGIGHAIAETTYLHLAYEFSLAEKVDLAADTKKYSQNQSDASFTIGRKLLEQRFDVNVGANLHIGHGGVNFSDFTVPGKLTQDEFQFHDAILKESVFLVGVGVGYQLTSSLGVSLAGRLFVKGANTQNASVLALGFAWSPL